MKESHRIFRDAERLQPPAGMWQRIEAQSRLAPRGRSRSWAGLESPLLRAAAVVVLAAGALVVAIVGVSSRLPKDKGVHQSMAAATVKTAPAEQNADGAQQIFDSELLGWQADLGEVDLEAEAAEEVL